MSEGKWVADRSKTLGLREAYVASHQGLGAIKVRVVAKSIRAVVRKAQPWLRLNGASVNNGRCSHA